MPTEGMWHSACTAPLGASPTTLGVWRAKDRRGRRGQLRRPRSQGAPVHRTMRGQTAHDLC
eukprot:3430055-Prymnesium_polylepis.1